MYDLISYGLTQREHTLSEYKSRSPLQPHSYLTENGVAANHINGKKARQAYTLSPGPEIVPVPGPQRGDKIGAGIIISNPHSQEMW